VIAEAVETEEQLADLSAMGCDCAQGYFFHRPLAADKVAELLRQQADTDRGLALQVA
jgi:EAL domain-containing protein (putative c-di-GMP-specific phosphodiesterase class I)